MRLKVGNCCLSRHAFHDASSVPVYSVVQFVGRMTIMAANITASSQGNKQGI